MPNNPTALADRLETISLDSLSEQDIATIEEVAQALREMDRWVPEWQPIKTAPKKGGKRVLILLPDGDVRAAYYDSHFHIRWSEQSQNTYYRGAWTDDAVTDWNYQITAEYQPVGWMPLPSPPAEAGR